MLQQSKRIVIQAINEDTTMSRWQKARARFAVFIMGPGRWARVEQAIISEAIQAGVLEESQLGENIDWDAILAFIKELLPIILEIIMMFL